MQLKKGKVQRNKSESEGSQFLVLKNLSKLTDKTLPQMRERIKNGLDNPSGTSISQDLHYEQYVKIKFGIKDLKKEEIIRKKEKLKYLKKTNRTLDHSLVNSRNSLILTINSEEDKSVSSHKSSKKDLPAITLSDHHNIFDSTMEDKSLEGTLDEFNSNSNLKLPGISTQHLLAFENVLFGCNR